MNLAPVGIVFFFLFFFPGNCMCEIKYCSHLLLPNLCTLFGNLPPFGQCILCSILSDFFFFPRSTFSNSRVREAMHQTFFLWGLSLAWVVYDILLQNYLKTVLAGCYWVRLHVWSLLIVDCLWVRLSFIFELYLHCWCTLCVRGYQGDKEAKRRAC